MFIFTQIKYKSLSLHATIIEKINHHSINEIPFFLLVNFECTETNFYTLDELDNEYILVEFPAFKTNHSNFNTQIHDLDLKPIPISFVEYQSQFQKVMKHLQYGNSFLTNLTAATPLMWHGKLAHIFNQAKAKYKILFKDKWVCFSPETFIKIEAGKIFSFPMKGTIDAHLPEAEKTILNDEKETAEHFTIVDLIRNDLSQVSEKVIVEKFRYIDKIETNQKTLLQVSSKIVGHLPKGYQSNLGDIIFKLLPAGSISGAPKKKTLEIINEAENSKRGFYTGVAFYFDGKNLDSCVLIRFVENTNDGMVYKSGGGITINSEVEKEYEELLNKIYVPHNSK